MSNYKEITHEELKKKLDNKEDIAVIDTLGEMSYERAHLPRAVMIDGHEADFVGKVEKMFPDKNKEIVVYCASFSCPLSGASANKLMGVGYKNVSAFEGGLMDWAEAGYDFEGNQAQEMKAKWSKK